MATFRIPTGLPPRAPNLPPKLRLTSPEGGKLEIKRIWGCQRATWDITGVKITTLSQKIFYYLRSFFDGSCFVLTSGETKHLTLADLSDNEIVEINELTSNQAGIRKLSWRDLFYPTY